MSRLKPNQKPIPAVNAVSFALSEAPLAIFFLAPTRSCAKSKALNSAPAAIYCVFKSPKVGFDKIGLFSNAVGALKVESFGPMAYTSYEEALKLMERN